MANFDLVSGFVGGINYAKRHPDFLEFDAKKYVDETLDWANYHRRFAIRELNMCNKAADKFFDFRSDYREEHIDDLKKIVWYAQVCLDEEKYRLDRKKAYKDLGMKEIFETY